MWSLFSPHLVYGLDWFTWLIKASGLPLKLHPGGPNDADQGQDHQGKSNDDRKPVLRDFHRSPPSINVTIRLNADNLGGRRVRPGHARTVCLRTVGMGPLLSPASTAVLATSKQPSRAQPISPVYVLHSTLIMLYCTRCHTRMEMSLYLILS